MNEDPDEILGIASPASRSFSAGNARDELSCPKCAKVEVARPFGWGAFGLSIITFFAACGIIQAIRSEGVPGFQLENLLDFASVAVVVSVVWIFFSALFGKNRCKACGHRWKRKGDDSQPIGGEREGLLDGDKVRRAVKIYAYLRENKGGHKAGAIGIALGFTASQVRECIDLWNDMNKEKAIQTSGKQSFDTAYFV